MYTFILDCQITSEECDEFCPVLRDVQLYKSEHSIWFRLLGQRACMLKPCSCVVDFTEMVGKNMILGVLGIAVPGRDVLAYKDRQIK